MPMFLIEREIPGASGLPQAELQKIAQRSMCAMEHIPGYRWHHSYVTGDRFFCVHEARNEEAIREHSRRGGFPVLKISEIAGVVGPETAEQPGAAPEPARRGALATSGAPND